MCTGGRQRQLRKFGEVLAVAPRGSSPASPGLSTTQGQPLARQLQGRPLPKWSRALASQPQPQLHPR